MQQKTKQDAKAATTDAPGINFQTTESATDASPEDTGIESPVPAPENVLPPFFWRRITNKDVKAAIHGSYLETICDALAKDYRRNIPFPLIIGQAVILMSAALTHQGKLPGFEFDFSGDIEQRHNLPPAKLSRLYIKTGRGNVPNAYVMIVAPSGAGKGMGCIRLVEAVDYQRISDGSPEGIKDAAVENPHCIVELEEFCQILQGRGTQGRIKRFLTEMFNEGKFNDRLSKRSNAPDRSAPWFYPTVYAGIQPKMLKAIGRELDIAQGLFGRFLIFTLDEDDMNYSFNPCNPDADEDAERLQNGLLAISKLEGVVVIPDPDYNIKYIDPILAEISPTMRPLVLRYGNEYLPRIALMLAIPSDLSSLSQTPPVLTANHLDRARVILNWILAMAESALGVLTNLEGYARNQEENYYRMLERIARISKKNSNPAVAMAQISHASSGTGWDSRTREELLNELSARGWIKIFARNGQQLESVEKGCVIGLNTKEIPPGIL